jgi:hypothetical protein
VNELPLMSNAKKCSTLVPDMVSRLPQPTKSNQRVHTQSVAAHLVSRNVGFHAGPVVALHGSFIGLVDPVVACQDVSMNVFQDRRDNAMSRKRMTWLGFSFLLICLQTKPSSMKKSFLYSRIRHCRWMSWGNFWWSRNC